MNQGENECAERKITRIRQEGEREGERKMELH